jgi:hypothetical protein
MSEGSHPKGSAFGIALRALDELSAFVTLCWGGLGYARVAPDLAAGLSGATDDVTGLTLSREQGAKLRQFAQAQWSSGYPYLYGLAAVRVWTILEVFVQDSFIALLPRRPDVLTLPAIKRLRGPLIEYSQAPPAKQAEFLYSLLVDDQSAPLKRGVGRFEAVFDALDLGGPVDDEVRRYILELSEVRNAVAHRNGIADERFVANCPWFGARDGEPLAVSHPKLGKYLQSAKWYVVEVSRRTLRRYPPDDMTGIATEEKHRALQAWLAEMIRSVVKEPAMPDLGESPDAG